MSLFDHIDRKAFELASGMMRDVLDQRALDFLMERKDILRAIITLRKIGKFEISQREAQQLVTLGIMQVDGQGYFLSEVVEDLVDLVIKNAEKLKAKEDNDAPESRPN